MIYLRALADLFKFLCLLVGAFALVWGLWAVITVFGYPN